MESGRYLKSVLAQPLNAPGQSQLFICCDWEVPNQGSFSLVCADGVNAFQLQGARHPPESPFDEAQYLGFCFNALCKTKPDQDYDFKYGVHSPTGQLQLSFTFTFVGTDGVGRRTSIILSLPPAPNPPATIRALLSLSLKNMTEAMALHDRSQEDFKRLQKQLGDCQKDLEHHVAVNRNKEKELYTKFSLLLNSKAEKLKQLRDENTNLLSELTKWRPPAEEEPGVDEGDLALQDIQSEERNT